MRSVRELFERRKKTGITYLFQDSLPRNPIPSIDATLHSYEKNVELLLPEQETTEFQRIVHNFRDTQLKSFNQSFVESANNSPKSYFDDYWNDYFLSDRRPLPLRDNGAVLFTNLPIPSLSPSAFYSQKVIVVSQVSRAVLSTLEFYERVRNEELEPDIIRHTDVDPDLYPRRRWFEFQDKFIDPRRGSEKPIPFTSWRFNVALKFNQFGLKMNPTEAANHLGFTPRDMSEYKTLFSTARVPGPETDTIRTFPESNHIIIIRRGNLWKLEVFSEFGGKRKLIDPSFLYSCLSEIHDDTTVDVGVGALTTLNREEWRVWRKRLVGISKENQNNIQLIESAIFVLSLDEVSSVTDDFARAEILHGNSRNRWFDKSLTLVVLKDGRMGLNFHKTWDGRAICRLMNEISTSLRKPSPILNSLSGTKVSAFSALTGTATNEPEDSSNPKSSWSFFTPRNQAHKLRWFIPNDVEVKIKEADKNFHLKRRALTIRGVTIDTIGKQYFKSHGLPPDFAVHIALMIAHKRLFDNVPTIKQYVMNSVFSNGRMNVIRPVSQEAIDFVQTLVGPQSASIDTPEQYKKLLAASRRHSQLLSQAHQGQSFDIHMNALYHFLIKSLKQQYHQEQAQQQQHGVGVGHIPLFFRHHSWKHFVYDNNRITTNSISADDLESGVNAPIQLDSFAFTYGMRTDSAYMTIASYHSPSEVNQFLEQIVRASNDLSSVLKTSFLTNKWII